MITIVRFFRNLHWQLGDGLHLALQILGEEDLIFPVDPAGNQPLEGVTK